jgi:hypothetical protein
MAPLAPAWLPRTAVVVALVALLALLPARSSTAPAAGKNDDPVWLFDPLHVNEIDLDASGAALSSLRAEPKKYVDAQITLHNGTSNYGPYTVGLKLKGHSSFRDLDGKAAFKIKFGHSVPKQEFEGLKGLMLNNMAQDPSMIAEATASLMLAAIGVPSSRVGFAWVRLNGDDYGLYATVETVDKSFAKRWFPSTQHIYEANYTDDVVPGEAQRFNVSVGSSKDVSDLEALIRAAAGDAPGWSERMSPVADLTEMALAFAAEHYMGQWDGYSYGSTQAQPNNYDLHSDSAGRFSMILTGTDQTWVDGPNFGLTGNGALFRECLAATGCQPLYMAALRQIAANRKVQELASTARRIDAAVAPWRRRDPRLEQSVADSEAQAETKIAFIASRPAQLERWLGDSASSKASPAPATSVRPVLGKPVAMPAFPRAGRQFSVSVPVMRSDNGRPLRSGTLIAGASLGTVTFAHTDSFSHGTARLLLVLPRTAKGKLLRVKIELTAARRTALGVYTYTVR